VISVPAVAVPRVQPKLNRAKPSNGGGPAQFEVLAALAVLLIGAMLTSDWRWVADN